MTTSWAQNEPFPPWQFDDLLQLNVGQYSSKASVKVAIYIKEGTTKLRKSENEESVKLIEDSKY